MNSPGHRANILSPQAREIGIGHAYGPASTYEHYWTMELGARAGAPAPDRPPTPPPPRPRRRSPTATAAPDRARARRPPRRRSRDSLRRSVVR